MTSTSRSTTRALLATKDVMRGDKGQERGINKCRLVSQICNPRLDTVSQRSALITSVYGHESQQSATLYTTKSASQLSLKYSWTGNRSLFCVWAKACRFFRVINAAVTNCEGMTEGKDVTLGNLSLSQRVHSLLRQFSLSSVPQMMFLSRLWITPTSTSQMVYLLWGLC